MGKKKKVSKSESSKILEFINKNGRISKRIEERKANEEKEAQKKSEN